MRIEFTVIGRPQQRGSKRAILPKGARYPRIIDDNKRSGPWMAQVRDSAHNAYRGELLLGAIRLDAIFRLKRPQTHYGTGRNAGKLKASAPVIHTQSPDLAKLIRCLEDALTGVIYRDDRQIFEYGTLRREWTTSAEGVSVAVEEVNSEVILKEEEYLWKSGSSRVLKTVGEPKASGNPF